MGDAASMSQEDINAYEAKHQDIEITHNEARLKLSRAESDLAVLRTALEEIVTGKDGNPELCAVEALHDCGFPVPEAGSAENRRTNTPINSMHHPVCNYWGKPVGAPGCICGVSLRSYMVSAGWQELAPKVFDRNFEPDSRVVLGLIRDIIDRDVSNALNRIRGLLVDEDTKNNTPIDMVLYCPMCGVQHIDEPEYKVDPHDMEQGRILVWGNPPHRSHKCATCSHIWRPADVPTNGVAAVKTKGKEDSEIGNMARYTQGYDAGIASCADNVMGYEKEIVELRSTISSARALLKKALAL